MVQAALVVVDEDGGGDVHGIDQAETFSDAALPNEIFDIGGDVDESATSGNFEPEMFGQGFQFRLPDESPRSSRISDLKSRPFVSTGRLWFVTFFANIFLHAVAGFQIFAFNIIGLCTDRSSLFPRCTSVIACRR